MAMNDRRVLRKKRKKKKKSRKRKSRTKKKKSTKKVPPKDAELEQSERKQQMDAVLTTTDKVLSKDAAKLKTIHMFETYIQRDELDV